MRWIRHHIQLVALAIWLLLLSTGAYAFSQLSSVPDVPAEGFVAGASGFTVTHIAYRLSAADPSRIAQLAFTLTPSSSAARVTTVRAKLVSASNSYSLCVNIPARSNKWECPISGVTLTSADQLRINVGEPQTATKYVLRLPLIRVVRGMNFMPLIAR